MTKGIEVLADSNRGQYIPQILVPELHKSGWLCIGQRELEIASVGPEHEEYWDMWNSVLQSSTYCDTDGREWSLHQDGDVFGICTDIMSPEDHLNLFGEYNV